MKVELLNTMGDDLTVVNAARVSYSKIAEKMTDKDEKLIKYLVDHDHWSPFAHATAQFRIQAPIYVARQLVKHQVGLSWNEISRRYVDTDVEFHEVDKWRGRAEDKKQGSDEENIIEWVSRSQRTGALKSHVENIALENYKKLLEAGVAPEQARMILPQSMMTEWYWSGTLYAFARVCNLRCALDAQYETRIVANLINKECGKLFPISWIELRNT